MSEKIIKGRLVQKHDTEANWLKATNFIPKQSEIIIYDVDENYTYERIKIGDGTTVVNSLPFASTQSDWSQNDEMAIDYIQNRTHYVAGQEEIETVFESDALLFESYGDGIYSYTNTIEFPEYITEIYTFKVVWDGVEYMCDRTSLSYNYYLMMPTLILGNMSIDGYGIDSGEPFCISIDEGTGYMKVTTNHVGATHSLQIVAVYEDLKQLSEKYIPGSIARTSDIDDLSSYMLEELQYKAEQTELDTVKGLIGDTPVATQITNAVATKSAVQIITWGADD